MSVHVCFEIARGSLQIIGGFIMVIGSFNIMGHLWDASLLSNYSLHDIKMAFPTAIAILLTGICFEIVSILIGWNYKHKRLE